ncbi:MAG TPA: ROK family protein [Gaiellaceae bacterium]
MNERIVLAVDIGGSHVKALASNQTERRRFASSPKLTPQEMVDGTLEAVAGWEWDVVSIGIPTPIRNGRPVMEPPNLGKGWVDFDYEAAFGKPTKVVNDAVMQAVGSYRGGRMLFLGLGTGLGSTLIVDGTIVGLELGHLPYRKKTFEDYVGEAYRDNKGKKRWRKLALDTVTRLSAATLPDEVVLGGGGAKELDALPPGCRLGANENAFVGGFRLWDPDWASSSAAGAGAS